jgi:hypothetical protein
MDWRNENVTEEDVSRGFRNMPKPKLSAEDKAKMLRELKELEATIKVRKFPRWIGGAMAGVAGLAIVGVGFLAFKPHNPNTSLPAMAATQQNDKLQAATTRLQKVTDSLGNKAPQLHTLLTHTVGVLDAWAYGTSEIPGQGDFSFSPSISQLRVKHDPATAPGIEPYLQADYDKFQALFSSELSQIATLPIFHGRRLYAQAVEQNGAKKILIRDDWAVLDTINQAYKQALQYYSPENYAKLPSYNEQIVGNDTEATQAANTLREWNDLLFGGRIQLKDVPKPQK